MNLFPSMKACPSSPCRSLLLGAMLVLAAGVAAAQEVNSSPSVVGSGARALGMGGAFIAVADDATAASWNPGGLTQLERPEISAVVNYNYYNESFSSGQRFTQTGDEDLGYLELNYFSAAWPFRRTIAGRNFVVSLNYQQKWDFERELSFDYRILQNFGGNLLQQAGQVDFDQEGSLAALSPAFAIELTNRLSVGATVNFWDSDFVPENEWTKTTRSGYWNRFGATLIYGSLVEEERYEDVEGMNYSFGILYQPTARLKIGAVYHTAWSADVDWTLKRTAIAPPSSAVLKQDRRIEFPGTWGLGIAYRWPGDRLTLSLDVTRRNWDRFVEVQKGFTFGEPRRISPITNEPKWRSPHDATTTVRAGAEYVFFNPEQPLKQYLPSIRAGLFYDPAPSGGRDVNFLGLSDIDGEPDDFYGVSLGAGVLWRNRVNIDFAYVYRWGDDVRKDTFSMWDVSGDVDQHEFYLSTVIYF